MKLKLKERKYIFWDLLLISLILCLIIIISACGLLNYFNWKMFDTFFSINRSFPEHRDNVVIVCIDQKSIDFFDKQAGISWPWPREFHGQLVRYLTECGAKAIVFDVIFSESLMSGSTQTDFKSPQDFFLKLYVSPLIQQVLHSFG